MGKDNNKKDKNIKQINKDYEEDRVKIFVDNDINELDKIALKKNFYIDKVIVFYIIIFIGILICSISQIVSYYEKQKLYSNSNNQSEVKSDESKLLIFNDQSVPNINEKVIVDEESNEAMVESVSKLNLVIEKESKANISYNYNVRYRIYDNMSEYDENLAPKILVRFSYSEDKKNWNYVNNAISTTNGTIMPLMGNYYDITNLESTLQVATNLEIEGKPGENKELYWRAETTYKNIDINSNKRILNAAFSVEYTR